MAEDEGQGQVARVVGLLITAVSRSIRALFVALAAFSIAAGIAVCLVSLLTLLVGRGEARGASVELAIAGASWAVFSWRLLIWARQQRWPEQLRTPSARDDIAPG